MGKLRHRAVWGVTSPSRSPGRSPLPPAMPSGPRLPLTPLDAAATLGPDAGGHHVGSTAQALGLVQDRCGVPITASGGIWRVAGPWFPLLLTSPWWRGSFLKCNGGGQASLNSQKINSKIFPANYMESGQHFPTLCSGGGSPGISDSHSLCGREKQGTPPSGIPRLPPSMSSPCQDQML